MVPRGGGLWVSCEFAFRCWLGYLKASLVPFLVPKEVAIITGAGCPRCLTNNDSNKLVKLHSCESCKGECLQGRYRDLRHGSLVLDSCRNPLHIRKRRNGYTQA
jgi:hypothetical protein